MERPPPVGALQCSQPTSARSRGARRHRPTYFHTPQTLLHNVSNPVCGAVPARPERTPAARAHFRSVQLAAGEAADTAPAPACFLEAPSRTAAQQLGRAAVSESGRFKVRCQQVTEL
ncbi:hypothetical protein AOLI_G00183290 [Acnodon oligacanthus]